jgi:hypothetical protein
MYDISADEVPQSRLGGPASSLSQYPLANSDIANSTVTVAGNSVGLGGSTGVSYSDLSDTATSFPIPDGDLDESYALTARFPLPNSDLQDSQVTVAGNSVALGGSTDVAHGNLADAPADAHHSQDHDNTDHTEEYVAEGDGVTRDIYVIAAGASDPSSATADDLIFEEA